MRYFAGVVFSPRRTRVRPSHLLKLIGKCDLPSKSEVIAFIRVDGRVRSARSGVLLTATTTHARVLKKLQEMENTENEEKQEKEE